MIRIRHTRMTFRGWRGSAERASEISQRALREVAAIAAHAELRPRASRWGASS